jgi:hypothetical protein
MRDLRRLLERLEAAESDDTYPITVVWGDDDRPESSPGRRIRLHWGDDHEPSRETSDTP